MSNPPPRQPPRFVPTLTEVVQVTEVQTPLRADSPAEPSELPEYSQASPTSAPMADAAWEQSINDWLDRWLTEHAPGLVEQLVDRIADDLRHALLQQARQAWADRPVPTDSDSL